MMRPATADVNKFHAGLIAAQCPPDVARQLTDIFAHVRDLRGAGFQTAFEITMQIARKIAVNNETN